MEDSSDGLEGFANFCLALGRGGLHPIGLVLDVDGLDGLPLVLEGFGERLV